MVNCSRNLLSRHFHHLKFFSPIQYAEGTALKWGTRLGLILEPIPFYGSYIWGASNFIYSTHNVTEIERAWESIQADSETSGSSRWLILQSWGCVNHPALPVSLDIGRCVCLCVCLDQTLCTIIYWDPTILERAENRQRRVFILQRNRADWQRFWRVCTYRTSQRDYNTADTVYLNECISDFHGRLTQLEETNDEPNSHLSWCSWHLPVSEDIYN